MQAQNKRKSARERFSFECAEQQVSACVELEEQSGACTEQAQGGARRAQAQSNSAGQSEYERFSSAHGAAATSASAERAQAQNEHKAVQRRDNNFKPSTTRSKRVQAQNKRKSVRERFSLEECIMCRATTSERMRTARRAIGSMHRASARRSKRAQAQRNIAWQSEEERDFRARVELQRRAQAQNERKRRTSARQCRGEITIFRHSEHQQAGLEASIKRCKRGRASGRLWNLVVRGASK